MDLFLFLKGHPVSSFWAMNSTPYLIHVISQRSYPLNTISGFIWWWSFQICFKRNFQRVSPTETTVKDTPHTMAFPTFPEQDRGRQGPDFSALEYTVQSQVKHLRILTEWLIYLCILVIWNWHEIFFTGEFLSKNLSILFELIFFCFALNRE